MSCRLAAVAVDARRPPVPHHQLLVMRVLRAATPQPPPLYSPVAASVRSRPAVRMWMDMFHSGRKGAAPRPGRGRVDSSGAPDGLLAVVRLSPRGFAGCGVVRYGSSARQEDDWREADGGGSHKQTYPMWVAHEAGEEYLIGVPNGVDTRMAHISRNVCMGPAEIARPTGAAGMALVDVLVLANEAAGMATLLAALLWLHALFSLGDAAQAMSPMPDGRQRLRFVTVGWPQRTGATGVALLAEQCATPHSSVRAHRRLFMGGLATMGE